MPRGGTRPGAGRKKGPQALEKEAMRALLRQKVYEEMGPLVEAQIANARGIKYLVVRDKKTGKFLRVAEDAAATLKADEEIIEVWEKDPSVHAFTDLMNRAIDKPVEQMEVGGPGGAPFGPVTLVVKLREGQA